MTPDFSLVQTLYIESATSIEIMISRKRQNDFEHPWLGSFDRLMGDAFSVLAGVVDLGTSSRESFNLRTFLLR